MEIKKELVDALTADDQQRVSDLLETIKQEGDVNSITMLLDTIVECKESPSIGLVVNLLADVKNEKFKEILITILFDDNYLSIQNFVARIAWESNIDLSDQIDPLIDLFTSATFATCMEVSTVISENLPRLTQERVAEVKISLSQLNVDEATQFLIDDLLAEIEEMQH